jgi:Holliday junction DNA helicase RuvB
MHIERINTTIHKKIWWKKIRPDSFDSFIWQEHITRILKTAIDSAQKKSHPLWHILLSWPSGYGKTTLAHITTAIYGKQFHTVTWYVISKPAELISIMTSMNEGDVLFIDEIHRIKPILEEMLYIAMEDFAIDMMMGDGWAVRVPLKPFTLIGATTKPESLTEPLKNRFIYSFHCVDYNDDEKHKIVKRYLDHYDIQYTANLIELMARKVDTVPRKIHNLIVKIRDFLISTQHNLILNEKNRPDCESRLSIRDGGITNIHEQYLNILKANTWAVWLKTIALQLGINEESVENEIEPLLLKSGLIEKTGRGRILL